MRLLRFSLVACAIFVVTGCGYGFKQGRVREGLSTVAVPFFENRSTEPDVEIELTESIIAGIVQDRTLKVVDEKFADAIVGGVLRRYEFVESFFGGNREAEEYKVRIVVEVTMVDRISNEAVAGPKTVRGEGTYLVEDGAQGEAAAREIATQEIIDGILNMVVEEW